MKSAANSNQFQIFIGIVTNADSNGDLSKLTIGIQSNLQTKLVVNLR